MRNVICDRCGFKYKANELHKEPQTGYMVCRLCLDPRRQINMAPRPARPQVPWVSPQIDIPQDYNLFSPDIAASSIQLTGGSLTGHFVSSALTSASISMTGSEIQTGDFVAFNNAGFGAISYDNAVTWKEMTTPPSFNVTSVAWNGTRYCAVGGSTTKVSVSTDGDVWSDVTVDTAGSSAGYTEIVWTGTFFCAVSHTAGSNPGVSIVSTDGLTWDSGSTLTFTRADSLAWSDTEELLVCIGNSNDVGKRCQTSPDGLIWTSRTLAQPGSNIIGGVWTGTQYVFALAPGGSTSSADGITWTAWSGSATGYNLASNGSGVIVGVAGPKSYVSTDFGDTWNDHDIGLLIAGTDYRYVAYNGAVFCAVDFTSVDPTYSYISATSTDGVTWTERQNLLNTASWVTIGSNYLP